MSKIVFNFVLGILATCGLASKDSSASTRALMNNFGSIFQYIELSEWNFHRAIVYSQRFIRYRKTTKQVVVSFCPYCFFLSGIIFMIKVWKRPFARIKYCHMHCLICQPWMTPWIDWSCHDHIHSNYNIFLLGFKSDHLWLKFSTVRDEHKRERVPVIFSRLPWAIRAEVQRYAVTSCRFVIPTYFQQREPQKHSCSHCYLILGIHAIDRMYDTGHPMEIIRCIKFFVVVAWSIIGRLRYFDVFTHTRQGLTKCKR